jgi:hypothetical protein
MKQFKEAVSNFELGLLDPEIVLYKGHVIFKSGKKTIKRWEKTPVKELDSVSKREGSVNHIHLSSYYLMGLLEDGELSENTIKAWNKFIREYARLLVRTWKSVLKEQFPDKKFAFQLSFETDEGLVVPTVSFWQDLDNSMDRYKAKI